MKNTSIEIFCDRGIFFSLCASIFVLPASIALLDSFAAMAVLFYLLKKINRMAIDWPLKTASLRWRAKIHFIWNGFAPPANFLNRPLQWLAAVVFISVMFSQYPELSLLAFMGKFLKAVFLYFSFIEVFRDEKRVWIFLGFFLASAFITTLSGVVQHYGGKDFFKGHLISSYRINASFFSANGFGAYLLPVIGLDAHLLFTAITRKKSWLLSGVFAFLLALLLVCLCWTYSRSSWIGFLTILFVMVLIDWRKFILGAVLLLVFIFVFLPSLNNIRHLYLINDNNYEWSVQKENSPQGVKSILEDGGSGRLAYWKKAISIIDTSPAWGTGLNTYTKVIKRDPDPKSWWYAHNCYLQMAAETGLLGLVCFLWVMVTLLWHGFSYCQKIKDLWPLTILQGALSGLFGFLVQSFFDNTFYTVQLGILMWLTVGLLVAVTRLNPSSESKKDL